MKNHWLPWMALGVWLLPGWTGCGAAGIETPAEKSATSAAILESLDRSLKWLEAHPPDPRHSPLGEIGMDAWSWNLFSRLHPDPEIRTLAQRWAKVRLQSLKPEIEPTLTSLSWWALLIRCLKSQGEDVTPYWEALARVDISKVLREGNPTTALWITELLGYSGYPVESDLSNIFIARYAADPEAFKPSVRDAMAHYHEIAPLTDLGRAPLARLTRDQVAFAVNALPSLWRVCRQEQNVDAAAETLIAAALLGRREEAFYAEGIRWLVAQQRPDGTYPRAPGLLAGKGSQQYRHSILVVSWALLERLQ